jgi:two-component system nitrogen regulation sensor histidine kinase NtrY
VALTPRSPDQEFARTDTRQRRTAVAVLSVMIVLLFVILFSQAAFNLTFLQPNSNQQTFVFAGLSAVIFLLFVALTFVLMRNLLKLYGEARGGVLGSRFRTKMVAGALLLSVTPTVFLFLFAYALMNRSIDKWFSRPVEELRQNSQSVASLLETYIVRNANAEAKSIADSPETKRAYQTKNFGPLNEEMRRHEATLEGGFALALLNDDVVAGFHTPEPWPELRRSIHVHRRQGSTFETLKTADGRVFLYGSANFGKYGDVVVGLPVDSRLFNTLNEIEASQQRYYELAKSRKQVRQFYMLLLSVITAAVLFAAVWLSMYISRLVTRPVAALARGAQELSSGNLDYRIDYETNDELGQLIHRFNFMAAEISDRRRQLEAILESIPTGVVSIDEAGRVLLLNRAFARIFPGASVQPGFLWTEAFTPETADELKRLMRRADRMGIAGSQLELEQNNRRLDVAITVAALGDVRPGKSAQGHVLVFEDFSDLLKAQKQAAWQEVARRVAHEIKNPLTPISLSAERIKRYLEKSGIDGNPGIVMRSCADSIASNVETVRRLVNEFSSLARFPAAQPAPTDINKVVRHALAMFDGRLEGIRIRTRLAFDLPLLMADAEGLKRVVANLVDNAAEAMTDSLVKEISVSTNLVDSRDAVEITVADSGKGITPEIKEKLFLPYFSTKNRGTGLGLAIVSRVVEEHHGSIRAEENTPAGARFVVELPVVAAETANRSAIS